MTATEELRRLLDERGVAWVSYGHENHTWWNSSGVFGWHAENRPSVNGLFVKVEGVVTPKQAIAATIGETYTREECESAFVSGYSLGSLPVGSDPRWDENRQTVDEHMAELGWVRERTCRDKGGIGTKFPATFICSECGWYSPPFAFGEGMPCYCPQCGRRVEQ